MNKHKNPLPLKAPENRHADETDLLELESRHNGDHYEQLPVDTKKKEIDGLWVAAFLLGMLLLLLFVHWLRTN